MATLLISQMIDVGPRHLKIPQNVTLQFLHGGSLNFNLGGEFVITQWSLQELKKRKLPDEVISRLNLNLIGKVFTSKQHFMSNLSTIIGTDETTSYSWLILL